jgi:hypothetical protein
LLEARTKAGLGPAARGQASGPSISGGSSPAPAAATDGSRRTVVACAPAPPGADVEVYDPKRNVRAAALPSPADLATIIRQEIASALKK